MTGAFLGKVASQVNCIPTVIDGPWRQVAGGKKLVQVLGGLLAGSMLLLAFLCRCNSLLLSE
jgi:hypothetical protein